MKFRPLLTAALLTFVVVSLGVAIADVAGWRRSGDGHPTLEPAKGEQWTVFYFHSSHRCPTCRSIEANTRAAVKDEVAADGLTLRVLDYEAPAHRHFVEQFDLAFPTVILALLRDGATVRWKNLDRVWDLWEDPPAFVRYVQAEWAAFKEERP